MKILKALTFGIFLLSLVVLVYPTDAQVSYCYTVRTCNIWLDWCYATLPVALVGASEVRNCGPDCSFDCFVDSP